MGMSDGSEVSILCPDSTMDSIIRQLQTDDAGGLATIVSIQISYPLDPRLHFLRGSVLAGLQRYEEGRAAMARAIEIAPDYALARFQLGFLDLTSGRAVDAIGVWQPLFNLSDDEPLRIFAEGLTNLAGDNFAEARRLLQKGMELNTENPLISADMQLILDEIKDDAPGLATMPVADQSAPSSAAHMLLQQYELKDSVNAKKH
jgi:tetratricopeptide (TPR) repeat protein